MGSGTRHQEITVGRPELVEIVTPRTNAATMVATENFLAALSLAEPFSLEIAATRESRWFLARAANAATRLRLEAQLGAAYPQAEIHRLDCQRHPGLDPARLAPGEQVAASVLLLRGPRYLPLRTFRDTEVAAEHPSQADPVLGILAALGDLRDGWRALVQLVLRPASDDWCRGFLHLAVERPPVAPHGDTSLTSVFLMGGLLLAGGLAWTAYGWYNSADWLRLGLLAAGAAAGTPGLLWVLRRLADRPVYDPRLVQEKLSRIAYQAELRLAIFAPAGVPAAQVAAHVGHVAAAYRQFSLPAGNGLRSRPVCLRERDLRDLSSLPVGAPAMLNVREIAGLWHLPQVEADVPLLERTAARRHLPLPFMLSEGCRIGVSERQGVAVPVSLPEELLRRHLLLVAKTRRGKSSLLLRIARHLMERTTTGSERPMLVLVDPHRDLARAALGLVPPHRRGDVAYLDLAERRRPFGLNLIDAGLGWGRDKAVSNALGIFRREFDRFWGPRMEDAFRFALLTLYEANEAMCGAAPSGRGRQHTILEVPPLLVNAAFRRAVLGHVCSPTIKAWWSGYFDSLDRRMQIEIINPVQTKVQRFAGSEAARSIVGQPQSTLDPGAWLRSGSIVIVNTAKGVVGEDTSALVGGTIINLMALVIGEQAALDPAQRRPAALIVDEFHTMPGADYESVLSELAKYGASLVLATQSLAMLEALDREQHRALRATVFANLDGLFAFHTSAEDARYLVRELGREVDEQDLIELGEHRCYAKLSAHGERLPAFSVSLDPPPTGDPLVVEQLAVASAARYGRDLVAIETDLRAALARVESARKGGLDSGLAGQSGTGIAKDAPRDGGDDGEPRRGRNQHRKKEKGRPGPHQGTEFAVTEDKQAPAAQDPAARVEHSQGLDTKGEPLP